MKRIISLLIAFFLISILLLINCGKPSFTFPESSSDVYDGSFNSVTQTMIYANTEYIVELGTLTVLENRNKNNSRYIHLPVIRVRTNAEKPLEPVFCLTGGPGMSNLEHVGMKWYLMPNHDIVMVGYRGIDGSSILSCPEVAKAIKGKGDLFSEESIQALGQAWEKSALRLQKEGVDINGYTILDVIEDNELARRAFGYEKIDLQGVSYGTRVAYLYGLIHPESIHRTVMTAVNPPGRFVWERDVLDEQIREYSALWARDSSAEVRSKDLYSDIMRGLNSMPDRWLFLPIDKGKVRCVAFSLLFKNETAALVFDAFIAASQGDYSGFALMSLAYDYVMPEMFTWGELACKAVSADYDSTRDYIADMSPTEKYPMGSPMSELLWSPLNRG
ncbi:MAG: alpha/beta fold hydrolase, partial [Calditrichaceae bacterium]